MTKHKRQKREQRIGGNKTTREEIKINNLYCSFPLKNLNNSCKRIKHYLV